MCCVVDDGGFVCFYFSIIFVCAYLFIFLSLFMYVVGYDVSYLCCLLFVVSLSSDVSYLACLCMRTKSRVVHRNNSERTLGDHG